jgi:tryptophanyl-tRNA synthetase
MAAKVKTIDPWGSELPEDYEKIIKEFGMEVFDKKILSRLPNPNHLMRRGIVVGHQDLELIANAINSKKNFAVLTGIMPSGERLHLGNKLTIDMVRYFQEHGGETYVLVADLEALATRGISLKESRKRALNFHIPAYIALGLDAKKTHFYFQSENSTVRNLSVEFSNKLTLNEYRAIYGQPSAGKVISVLTQIADIMYPQVEEERPVVIPVGIDQSPHIRAARDVARRYKKRTFFLPSATYNKFTPSLDGSMKMSKSKPGSLITIPDSSDVGKKIMSAKTGGRGSEEEQRKLGGIPEDCVVFELYKQHLIEDDKELDDIYKRCKQGKLLCGKDKENCSKLMLEFLKKFEMRMEKAKKLVKGIKFLKE